MPLLGTKLHVPNPIWRKKKPRDDESGAEKEEKPAFLVAQTQEICASAEEVHRKTTVYSGNVWTCRVTGKPNMTYKDACRSEISSYRLLRKKIPKFFEKSILEHVHLSTFTASHLDTYFRYQRIRDTCSFLFNDITGAVLCFGTRQIESGVCFIQSVRYIFLYTLISFSIQGIITSVDRSEEASNQVTI